MKRRLRRLVCVLLVVIGIGIPGCENEPEYEMSPEMNRFFVIMDSIYERTDESFESLTDAEKAFFYVSWLEMQVHNGGWHQWYFNWDDAEREEAIEATIAILQEIDAQKTAEMVQRAVPILSAGASPEDPRLDQLNQELWEQPDNLAMLILEWAENQPDQFKVNSPG